MDLLSLLKPPNSVLAASLALALLLDYVYPEHRGILLKIHPVHTCFFMARRLGKPYSSRARGVATWFACTAAHIAPYALLLLIAYRINTLATILVCAYIAKVSMSVALLVNIVSEAREAMERGDWGKARSLVQLIVRRDVSKLSEGHVVSAAIESLAESLVDGFLSPLLYFLALGPLASLFQRIANTLDGALGYKTPEYRDVGWFSAKVDTVLNFVPARLLALSIALSGAILGLDWRRCLRTWLRYRGATESVNAGHPMSAMAGILGVKLEKPGFYTLGEGPLPTPRDLGKAIEVARVCVAMWIAIAFAVLLTPIVVRLL